jgi:hypothetical protein
MNEIPEHEKSASMKDCVPGWVYWYLLIYTVSALGLLSFLMFKIVTSQG